MLDLPFPKVPVIVISSKVGFSIIPYSFKLTNPSKGLISTVNVPVMLESGSPLIL